MKLRPWAAWLALGSLAGCGEVRDDPAADKPAAAPRSAPRPGAAGGRKAESTAPRSVGAPPNPLRPPADVGRPGLAYFFVRDKGLFVFDGAELARVRGGPDKFVRQMSVGGDGIVYLLALRRILEIDGGKAKLAVRTRYQDTGSVEAFAVAKDGGVWTVGFGGVAHHDGGAWQLEDKASLGDDVDLLKAVALAKDDTVWVASDSGLHARGPHGWTAVDLSRAYARKPFFVGLAVDPHGVVYASASAGVVRSTGTASIEAVDLKLAGFSSFGQLSFSQNGIMALKTRPSSLTVLAPDGTRAHYAAGTDFAGNRVLDLTADGRGRLWVATDGGVAILGPGDERVEWNSGRFAQLAGRVERVLVVGSGPELPSYGA